MRKFLLFFLLTMPCLPVFAQVNVDSLFDVYQHSKGTKHIAVANSLEKFFEKQGYLNYPVHFSKQSSSNEIDLVIYYGMSDYKYDEGAYYKVIEYALKSESVSPKDSLRWKSDNFFLINLAYQRIGQYDKALEYGIRCYRIDVKSGDETAISSSLNSLAGLYMANDRCDVALQYIKRAVAIERKLRREGPLAIRLGMMSDILLKLNRPEEALPIIQEALNLDKKEGREEKVGVRLSQMADIFMAQNKWQQAKNCCQDALPIFEKHHALMSNAICLRQLGNIYLHLGQPAQAKQYLLQCERICKQLKSDFMLQKVYYQLYELEKKSNPAEALTYFEQSTALKDTIFSLDKQKQISDFQVKYDTQEKEYQIALQKASIKRKNAHLVTLVTISILFIALFIVALLYARIQNKHKQALIIINNTKDKFFSIISHDLKNPVFAQKRMLDIICSHYDMISEEDLKEQCQLLKRSCDSVYDLIINLLEWGRMEIGKVQFKPVRFELSEAVRSCIELLSLQMQQKNIEIVNAVSDDVFVCADYNLTKTILRNILSNAIKYSYDGGKIEVRVEEVNKQYKISIVDYGVGISDERKKELFKLCTLSSEGTAGEKGIGLGLVVCKELVEKNKGVLSLVSEEGKGSTFSFTVNKEMKCKNK